MGTVMGWVDKKGTRHETLVLDASYRNVLPQGPNGLISSLGTNKGDNHYYFTMSGTTDSNPSSIANLTDSFINSHAKYFESGTCKVETSAIYNSGGSSTTYGSGWCRSKQVRHNNKVYSCDMPNNQTAIRIFSSCLALDNLDPTNATTYRFTNTATDINWFNKTEAHTTSQTDANSCTGIHHGGISSGNTKSSKFGIIPVLELELL